MVEFDSVLWAFNLQKWEMFLGLFSSCDDKEMAVWSARLCNLLWGRRDELST